AGRPERGDEVVGEVELPERPLDAQLPRGHRRELHVVRRLDEGGALGPELVGVLEPPQGHVAVEEEPHVPLAADSSKSAATSGSGPTPSPWRVTCPAHAPRTRVGRAGGHGMILATGCPLRATITSPP